MPLIALNKPFGTICQFSPHPTRPTLADHVKTPGVYPAGRLDADSEGLLLLTDDGALQARIALPRAKLIKRYWAQVEGVPHENAIAALRRGVDLGDFVTAPAQVRILPSSASVASAGAQEPVTGQRVPMDPESLLWARVPPIRVRAAIPTTWLEVEISEGKNRQVRRMTAAVGYPTLRLVRIAVGAVDIWQLGLRPGASCFLPSSAPWDRAGVR